MEKQAGEPGCRMLGGGVGNKKWFRSRPRGKITLEHL